MHSIIYAAFFTIWPAVVVNLMGLCPAAVTLHFCTALHWFGYSCMLQIKSNFSKKSLMLCSTSETSEFSLKSRCCGKMWLYTEVNSTGAVDHHRYEEIGMLFLLLLLLLTAPSLEINWSWDREAEKSKLWDCCCISCLEANCETTKSCFFSKPFKI